MKCWMIGLLAVVSVLGLAAMALGQDDAKAFADADQEQNWRELFDGKKLEDWRAAGAVEIKDGLLILGGPPTTTLNSTAPLGKKFTILIECKGDLPVATQMTLQTRTFLSRGTSGGTLDLKHGEWAELLLVGWTNEHGSVVLDTFARSLADKKLWRPAGQFGGQGTPSITLEVPPGGNLTIRRIRLQTDAPAGSPAGLFIGLAVLGFVMLSIIAGGRLLRRRKVTSPPA